MSDHVRTTIVIGAAQIADTGEQWIEVVPAVNEDRNGRFYFTITEEDLATYADSIKSQPGLIPIDYDHDGSMGSSTVAAGWFTGETEVIAAGGMTPAGEEQPHASLWAVVKWTPQAVQEIRDGRFKRLSPEVTFKDKDPKTGLCTRAGRVLASTLTNRPHFTQLAPVTAAALQDEDLQAVASDFGLTPEKVTALLARVAETQGGTPADTEEGVEMPNPALASALGLPEDATEEQIVAAATAAKEKSTAAARKPDAALAAVREALGLDENADEAAVIVAARGAREAAARLDSADDELETLRGADAQAKALKERVAALENERLTDQTKRILTEGVRAGKVLPAEKAVLAKQFATNPDGLLEIIATRPERSFGAIGSGDGGNDTESVRAIRSKFQSVEADGVDTESAILHARAEQWLAEQGKRGKYTELEYAEALEMASSDA